jgi:hypothetical protein
VFHVDLSKQDVIFLNGSAQQLQLIDRLRNCKLNTSLANIWNRSSINRNDSRIAATGIKFVPITGAKHAPVEIQHIQVDPAKFPGFGQWKVIINNVGDWTSLGNSKIVEPNIGTSYSTICFPVSNRSEAVVLQWYLTECALVKFIVRVVKNNTPNSKTVCSNIPLIDLSKQWTDEELYDHFNLTTDERALIKATIK